jgi:hypothetical protein
MCQSNAYRRSFSGLKVFVLYVLLPLTTFFFGIFFEYTLSLSFVVDFFVLLLDDVVTVGFGEVDFIVLGEVDFACVEVGVAIST